MEVLDRERLRAARELRKSGRKDPADTVGSSMLRTGYVSGKAEGRAKGEAEDHQQNLPETLQILSAQGGDAPDSDPA